MTWLREVVESFIRMVTVEIAALTVLVPPDDLVTTIAERAHNRTGKLPDRLKATCFLFTGRFACLWLEGGLCINLPWANYATKSSLTRPWFNPSKMVCYKSLCYI